MPLYRPHIPAQPLPRRILCTAVGLLLIASCHRDSTSAPARRAVALRVYPTGGAFNIGEPFLFSAARLASDSSELGTATGVTWTSSDTIIAVIRSDGNFRARCVGTAVVTAKTMEDSRVLVGQRSVLVVTGGSQCAASSLSTQTPNER